jgi:hypothetical protein
MRYDNLLGSEDHVLYEYIKPQECPRYLSLLECTSPSPWVSSSLHTPSSPQQSYPTKVLASRGIAVPITKHGTDSSPIDSVIDTSKLQSRIRDQALCRVGSLCSSFADRLGDLSTTDRKLQSRFAT